MASLSDGPDDYQAESDLRTLAQAEEIKKDPKRYKAALAKAKKRIGDLEALTAAPAKK